uniref:Uncharacterized protein n=1 Tax=Timema shepardi TaxID=629360 RepID=A0A7R9AVD9_TIMSH|nr:unnamed protein product [Timema shepardi]
MKVGSETKYQTRQVWFGGDGEAWVRILAGVDEGSPALSVYANRKYAGPTLRYVICRTVTPIHYRHVQLQDYVTVCGRTGAHYYLHVPLQDKYERIMGKYLYELYTHLHKGKVKNNFGKITLSTLNRDLNLNLHLIDSLIYCENSPLDHAGAEAEPHLCPGGLNCWTLTHFVACDGEIGAQIPEVGHWKLTCPVALAPFMVSVIHLFLLARKDTLICCEATPRLSPSDPPSHKIGFRLALDRAEDLKPVDPRRLEGRLRISSVRSLREYTSHVRGTSSLMLCPFSCMQLTWRGSFIVLDRRRKEPLPSPSPPASSEFEHVPSYSGGVSHPTSPLGLSQSSLTSSTSSPEELSLRDLSIRLKRSVSSGSTFKSRIGVLCHEGVYKISFTIEYFRRYFGRAVEISGWSECTGDMRASVANRYDDVNINIINNNNRTYTNFNQDRFFKAEPYTRLFWISRGLGDGDATTLLT